jgi:hypothetical protein
MVMGFMEVCSRKNYPKQIDPRQHESMCREEGKNAKEPPRRRQRDISADFADFRRLDENPICENLRNLRINLFIPVLFFAFSLRPSLLRGWHS